MVADMPRLRRTRFGGLRLGSEEMVFLHMRAPT